MSFGNLNVDKLVDADGASCCYLLASQRRTLRRLLRTRRR
jgi:hypothetical protein